MIMNNYHTMQRILELRNEPMTRELLLEIHSLVTANALDNPSANGRFRRPDENIIVADQYDEILHVPPPADELEARVDLFTLVCEQ